MVCFNGLTGYKHYARYTGGPADAGNRPPAEPRIGTSRVYVLPSTSPANAAVSLDRIVEAMREVKALAASERAGQGAP